jgi:hypothetical protein
MKTHLATIFLSTWVFFSSYLFAEPDQSKGKVELTVIQNFNLNDSYPDFKILKDADYSIPFKKRLAKVKKHASCPIKPLFSSEKSSWAFETFAVNGLFPLIAEYQLNHPSAVYVQGGKMTLSELYLCVNNSKVISKEGNKFTLKYPLIIGESALLTLTNDSLFLMADTGSLIVNLGLLAIDKSSISHVSHKKTQENERKEFRGFITSWANSGIHISHSSLSGLGYNGHLSGGVSLAVSTHQTEKRTPVFSYFDTVTFDNIYRPIWGDSASVYLLNSTFTSSHRSAIAIKNSDLYMNNNIIYKTLMGDGIKITDLKSAYVLNNTVSGAKSSGIKINGLNGSAQLVGNSIFSNGSSGITVTHNEESPSNAILIKANTVTSNMQSGISSVNITDLFLLDNLLEKNGKYGITAWSTTTGLHSLTIVSNQLRYNLEAAIKTEAVSSITLFDNIYRSSQVQSIFQGDLVPVQTKILKSMLTDGLAIQYRATH